MPSPTGSTQASQSSEPSRSELSRRADASESAFQRVSASLGQGHLAAHQQVVHHHQRPLGQLRLGQLDVARVLALAGVDEEQVEGAVEARERLERVALDDLDPVGHAAALEVVARLGGALGVALERDHAAVLELLGHVERRVADRGAHLEHHRVEHAAQHGEEPAGLPVDDRDPVALGVLLHLAHDRRALRPQVVQIALDHFFEDAHGARQATLVRHAWTSRSHPNRSRARAAPRARRLDRSDRRGPARRPLLRPRRHHAGRGRGARGLSPRTPASR